jgi:hypothetical protein
MDRLAGWIVRLVLTAFGLVFLASLFVAGLLAVPALALWALLHGRRPTLRGATRFSRPAWMPPRHGAAPGTARRRGAQDEVVDVEAREVGGDSAHSS